MKKYKMDKRIRKYCRRFVKENFSAASEVIDQKAKSIYQTFCNDAPDIGPGENLMAVNLYQFLTFLAYYEATDKKMTTADIHLVVEWMLGDLKFIGKFINMNNPGCCKLFYRVVYSYVAKVQKKKSKGQWGNTWAIQINPEKHDTGFSIHLVGCPLYDFAKTHGYENILPTMCRIDHDIATLMHAKLVRKHTIASGAATCDYWYVGDKMCE